MSVIGRTAGAVFAGLLSFALLSFPPAGSASEALTWQEAMDRVGQTVTVEAMIVDVYDPEEHGRSGPVSLNTDDDHRTSLSFVFFKRDRSGAEQGFGDPERFRDQVVRVRGRVADHQGRRQIMLRSPGDIEIVGALPSRVEEADAEPEEPSDPSEPLTWQEAMDRVGQTVTVEARIVGVHDPEARGRTGPVSLNTHRDFRESLSFVYFPRTREGADRGFGDPNRFLNQVVRVRGRVADYQGRKQIMLNSPDDIEIIETEEAEVEVEADPSEPLTWREAMDRLGQEVVVEARIVNLYDPAARGQTGPVRLNTHRDFRESLTIAFFPLTREGADRGFGDPSRFLNQKVRVRGRVDEHRGQKQIMLRSPEDIEILDVELPVVTPEEAMDRVGETVVVEGQIVDVYISRTRAPSRLNFYRDSRDRLTVAIFDTEAFGSLRANYLNKTVRVTGMVDTHRDQVQIVIDDPAMIEVVEAAD